ncbi:MAG: tetratricopeptide repeat protein, partial [Actinomycetota bacterium]|nr:tetratricopeptide repeat protein [Actinomycetota bacterium]
SRAVELLPEKDAARLDVLPDLGLALYEAGDYSAAIDVFEEAISLATMLDDARTATRCRIFKERARIHRDAQVNTEELRGVADRAVEILGSAGDDYGLAYAWDLSAYVHECAGRSTDALAAFRRAATHAERSGVPSLIGYQRRALVRSLAWGQGHVSEIIPLAEELLEWGRGVGDRYSQARALLTLAQSHAMLGQFDVAHQYVDLQEDVCADVSFEFVHASGAFERAQVQLLGGNVPAATAEARRGCETLQRIGEKAVLPTLQVQLADLAYMQGDAELARDLIQRARSLSAQDDSLTEMKWRSVMAKVLAKCGDVDEAQDLADEAVSIASATGYLDWQAGVLVDVGEVMARSGRNEEARNALRRARELYRQKGNIVSQRAIEDRLSEKPAV